MQTTEKTHKPGYWARNKKKIVFFGLVIIVAGYYIVRAATAVTPPSTYILKAVERGTIVSTVTGTGQVSPDNQVNITPRISGPLTSVRVQAGDYVARGQTLFTIDNRDAQKTVRDADLALQTALATTNQSDTDNARAVAIAYTNYLNTGIEAVPGDDPTQNRTAPVISGNYTLGKEGVITLTTYQSSGGVSFQASGLVDAAQLISTTTPQPLGNSGLYILFPATSSVGGTKWTITIPNKNASGYISAYNSYQSALLTQAQAKVDNSATLLGIQAKRNALSDAQQNLAYYSVTAPFSGLMATVPVKVGDQVSSGTTLGTIITKQNIATVTLNESDIAKIKIGQKVTMTFDAIPDLEMTGRVSSIDLIGTVSSGVVNYNVKISFDTYDKRIKSGMSVNANIATAIAQDVISIPTSAIKSSGGNSYVLVAPSGTTITTGTTGTLLPAAPQQVTVTKGISDDTSTEITSGLNEGDIVITKTIAPSTAKATTTTAPSLLGGGAAGGRGGALGGGGAGATRALSGR